MTDKDLQKLKRVELLEMLIEQSKELEELKTRLEACEKKLKDRDIMLSRAGNIAEASLMLNGVFDAAQAAAQQYLENIQRLSGRQEQVCSQMEQEVKDRCALLELETEKKCEERLQETEVKCQKMLFEAQEGVEKRWNDISRRLTDFYDAHNGLLELLNLVGANHLDFLGKDIVHNEKDIEDK